MDARESVVGIGRILFSSLSTLPVPQRGTPAFLPFLVAYGINPQALCYVATQQKWLSSCPGNRTRSSASSSNSATKL